MSYRLVSVHAPVGGRVSSALFLWDHAHLHTRAHTRALTFHLAALLRHSLVGFDWQLEQRLQVCHGGQVSALGATSSRVAGPELGAGGPGREIRR